MRIHVNLIRTELYASILCMANMASLQRRSLVIWYTLSSQATEINFQDKSSSELPLFHLKREFYSSFSR